MCLLLFVLVSSLSGAFAINHYVLNKEGFIQSRWDSPYYIREPENLIMFLKQINNNDNAEMAYLRLLQKRDQLGEHIHITDDLMRRIVERAQCVHQFISVRGSADLLRTTGASMRRLKFSEDLPTVEDSSLKGGDPLCGEFRKLTKDSGSGSGSGFDHLDSFRPDLIKAMRIEREEELIRQDHGADEAKQVTSTMHSIALRGLRARPDSWKFHMLASYYWRLVGEAQNAFECARLAVTMAPPAFKDIPLLSLGTILVRADRWDDAEVVLRAAVQNGPDHCENVIAFATLLALRHDFKRARQHFRMAQQLDKRLFDNALSMRQYIDCLEPLLNNTAKLFGYVKYMRREVKEVNKLKQEITTYHNKIIQQQVPLSTRYSDSNNSNVKEELLKRFQYCSTRKLDDSQDPVLFCDFYSDLQMKLQSKLFDVDLLSWQINLSKVTLLDNLPLEYRKQVEQLKSTAKAQVPSRENPDTAT